MAATPTISDMQGFNPDTETVTAYLEIFQMFLSANSIADNKLVPTGVTIRWIGPLDWTTGIRIMLITMRMRTTTFVRACISLTTYTYTLATHSVTKIFGVTNIRKWYVVSDRFTSPRSFCLGWLSNDGYKGNTSLFLSSIILCSEFIDHHE